ncbi:MAG: NHLP family bacteriocin export ABC transporter peptidase/permease/ATPase subunit [Spirochaetaceae bacterium]|jgi:NHLM bacteriocin system ABC transporter peptidase/ATP-binding protein|nr:NHLP family bacteriocin export ABC transporter peptidase/permease/ATPase subunit [Spirochaetaceae bacterium]
MMAEKRRGQASVKCPQIIQMEALECGAASLAMVLAYHGKWVPLEQVRGDCGVSRDGANAKNIIAAARNYGLTAKGYRFEPDQLKEAPLPCIIHWEFNHFVVFTGFKGGKALINDPARGAIELPIAEFDHAFTGVTLLFEPDANFEQGGKPRSVLQFARSRMKRLLLPFIFVALTGITSAILGIINPVLSRIFLDRILSGQSPLWLSGLLFALLALGVARIIIDLLQSLYLLKIEGTIAVTANAEFLWHILRLPLEFFSQRMVGDIAARQNSNQGIAFTLIRTIAPQVINVVMMVFYLVVMIRYSPLLTLVGVGTMTLDWWIARVISAKRVAASRVYARDAGKLAAATVNGIDMIETLKAAGAENGYFERWAGYQAAAASVQAHFTQPSTLLMNIPYLLKLLSSIALLGLGASLVIAGNFTLGMFMAFQGFFASCMAPVSSLIGAGESIQEMRTSMERVEDVLKYPADVHNAEKLDKDKDYKKLSGNLSMRDVSFGYSKLSPPIIEHFDLELKTGSTVAFVGPSGCGKSTLAKLISGLYKPWSGEIRFDGIPLEDIPREIVTASLAVVDQDITIFEDSIACNIKMWDKSIEDYEMILAAKDAQILSDVLVRDKGFSYTMLEGGRDFSGGQRQRLEIARLLAQDPTIIILDEATSALDSKTEHEVVEAIRKRDITCIFVAHRLSTIRDCDEIIVIDKGRVVERGAHEALFARDGLYTQLVTTE